MKSRAARRIYLCALAIALTTARPGSVDAADATIKVVFWNIMSGHGVDALPGHLAPFRNVANCTNTTQPLNSWGVGATQAALASVTSDTSVVAVGLAESWTSVCASPANVQQALGWRARTSERNGVALVARYGIAGPEQWLQLDTTLNPNPGDTMWVLRVPVCLDAPCARSMAVYVSHWYADGLDADATYNRQAAQTVAFLNATSNQLPHILVGDLNVWEGTAIVCNQSPTNGALPFLRAAGYLDAWLTLQGSNEGYTGMANRAGCGYPEGHAYKRIDYAWTLPTFQPIGIQRFAVTPAGDASPSDHYGLVVTLPDPGAPPPPPPPPAPSTVWTSIVKAVATGASLQKTSGCGECFDAGALGPDVIAETGSVSFTVSSGHRLIVGLGADRSAGTGYAIDYAFSFWPGGTWEIREKNVYRREGSFTAADRFTITLEGTAVKYYRNGVLVYTSGIPVTASLGVDTSLASLGATVEILSPAAEPPPPPPGSSVAVSWISLVKTIAGASSLQKTSGCGECFDAGAISQQQIAGSGGVSFSVSNGHRQIVGLGRDTTANTSYAIDYAFSFWAGGAFEIRESNTYRAEGSYAAGDVFKVAVEAGVVKYYKSDVLVYTSKVPVTTALVVDVSMATVGATVSNVTLK